MITIKQLNGIKVEFIHQAFIHAFADYVEPFNLTFNQFKHMIERRGCDLNLSFGAFNKNELVSFTLNGIGEWNGRTTAYDTGTGTIKEFRKKGIATKIFAESVPVLKENKVSQYLLEVIRSNTSAYELYKKAGFKVSREFDYYTSDKDKIKVKPKSLPRGFEIREIINPNWTLLKNFWEFKPSWQNSIESINRKIDYFRMLCVYKDNTVIGYGIIEKMTGDIPQFGISKKYRRIGLASALFNHLIDLSESDKIQIINTDTKYDPLKNFIKSVNFNPGFGQYEMMLEF